MHHWQNSLSLALRGLGFTLPENPYDWGASICVKWIHRKRLAKIEVLKNPYKLGTSR